MKQAIIDIGSNSIRLTLYETEGQSFKILFREKIMAGLAGYVEDGKLSAEGIECACAGLLTFRKILQTLQIGNVCIFATASLRNISNTERALSVIRAATGFSVEVISGEDEALFGYMGAMQELHLTGGAFLDIGGASTEIVTFEDGTPVDFASFPIGSLSLYRRCVKKILPGDGSLKRLRQEISKTIDISDGALAPRALLVGVGGTARAALKLARHYCGISDDCRSSTVFVRSFAAAKRKPVTSFCGWKPNASIHLCRDCSSCSMCFIYSMQNNWSSANTAFGKDIYAKEF